MTTLRHAEAKQTEKNHIKGVVVRGSGAGFSQEIVAGPHRMIADEPISAGGTDTGPTPYAGAKGCNVVSTMHAPADVADVRFLPVYGGESCLR